MSRDGLPVDATVSLSVYFPRIEMSRKDWPVGDTVSWS